LSTSLPWSSFLQFIVNTLTSKLWPAWNFIIVNP
jgi:hypothetical protein